MTEIYYLWMRKVKWKCIDTFKRLSGFFSVCTLLHSHYEKDKVQSFSFFWNHYGNIVVAVIDFLKITISTKNRQIQVSNEQKALNHRLIQQPCANQCFLKIKANHDVLKTLGLINDNGKFNKAAKKEKKSKLYGKSSRWRNKPLTISLSFDII